MSDFDALSHLLGVVSAMTFYGAFALVILHSL